MELVLEQPYGNNHLYSAEICSDVQHFLYLEKLIPWSGIAILLLCEWTCLELFGVSDSLSEIVCIFSGK